jgi:hypothetical protein
MDNSLLLDEALLAQDQGTGDGNIADEMVEDQMLEQEVDKDNKEYQEEEEKKRKAYSEILKITLDPDPIDPKTNKPFQDNKSKFIYKMEKWSKFTQDTGYSDEPDCPGSIDYPKNMNQLPIVVEKWGGIGGCGFKVWDDKGTKYWVDIDTRFNNLKKIDSSNKQSILQTIGEEDRGPECLSTLFPQGYTTIENGSLILPNSTIPTKNILGGRKSKKTKKIIKTRKYKKTKKAKKSKKSKKTRKSKKIRK